MNVVATKVYIDFIKFLTSFRAATLQIDIDHFENVSLTFEFNLTYFKSPAYNMHGHIITEWMGGGI